MTVSEVIIDLSEYGYPEHSYDSNIIVGPGYIEDMTYIGDIVPEIESLTVSPCPVVIVQAPGAPEPPTGCTSTVKYEGNTIALQATPRNGTGPYYVRFWRKSASGPYTELGTVRTVVEDTATTYNIVLTDSDIVGAVGDSTAGAPTIGAGGYITDPEDSSAPFTAGKIRVAVTMYDSCPTTPKTCISYCDVSLGCLAPVCNFTVT